MAFSKRNLPDGIKIVPPPADERLSIILLRVELTSDFPVVSNPKFLVSTIL